jgi:hypothetical protein
MEEAMGLALSIAGEEWWPFPAETLADLMNFQSDAEADRHMADPGPAMNDNWPVRLDSSRVSEQPAPIIWNPRWRTAD